MDEMDGGQLKEQMGTLVDEWMDEWMDESMDG